MDAKILVKKVEAALEDLKNGRLIIVADSQERESKGDLVGLAQTATGEVVNQMVTKARGLLCVPMNRKFVNRLSLTPLVEHGNDAFGTAFLTSVDAKTTSTGISAFDRADTIRQLADADSQTTDFYHPGHVFPLLADDLGVIGRQGHTEAAVDLAKLAGAAPVAYICEILKKDGTMARRNDLKAFGEGSQIKMLTIDEIRRYRLMKDPTLIKLITKVNLPTKYGTFQLQAFETPGGSETTLLVSKGKIQTDEPLLVRLHSECLTGDVFGSRRCDCGDQLDQALRSIEENGRGAVLYLRQEGRGIGLTNKLRAYQLQDQGLDTVEANQKLGFAPDLRNYGFAAAVLHSQKISRIKLMTNNPDKVNQLTSFGIQVVKRVPIEAPVTDENRSYLKTKQVKFHHIISEVN